MTKKIKKFLKSESGFTLIELLVVIGIIAILATIGAVNFAGARAKARDGKMSADLSQIRASIEAAAAGTADGLYPTTTLPTEISGANAPVVPRPTAQAYCYYVNTTRTQYILSASGLEDTSAGAVRDSGNLDADLNTAGWLAPVVINGIVGGCPVIAALAPFAPDCEDTVVNTLCYQGTTAS